MNSKEIKEVILLLNTSQASKNIDNLKKKLDETRRLKEEANKKGDNKAFKKLGLEEQKLERQLQRLTTRAQTVERAIKNIGKLAQLFGDADRMGLKLAMLATGSVINKLAQTSSADEGYSFGKKKGVGEGGFVKISYFCGRNEIPLSRAAQ